MENADPNIARVQRVAKPSSDELLRKFADTRDKFSAGDLRLAKLVKRKVCAGHVYDARSLPEKKSLLAPLNSHKLIRRVGLSKAKMRAREIKNKLIITALEKTWRRTVEGASRVMMENRYNRHKRLKNDSC